MLARREMKAARIKAGLTQKALGEKIGSNERAILFIETGRVSAIMPSIALRICSELKEEVGKLFPELHIGEKVL